MTHTLAALGYDPRSPDFRRDPYPAYRRLQQEAPRFYDAEKRRWVLSHYEDVRFVLHDPRFQFNDPAKVRLIDDESVRSIQQMPTSTRKLVLQLRKGIDLQTRFLDMRHPPGHTELRKLIQPWFEQSALQRLEKQIDIHANALIDTIVVDNSNTFDVVQRFTLPLTYGVLCHILGVEAASTMSWIGHTQDIIRGTDFGRTQADFERSAWSTYMLALGFLNLASQKGILHPDGLLDHLSKQVISEHIHEDDFLSLAILLFSAGHETSSNSLGLAIRNLLIREGTWHQLAIMPELVSSAVEELLRFESTVQARPHVALENVEIGDWKIQRGDRFRLLIGAANRDPRRFERADEIILDRKPNPHLAFLHGIHFCIGAPLARLTLRTGISVLLERMPNLRLVEHGETWLPTYWMRGFKRLLVTNGTP